MHGPNTNRTDTNCLYVRCVLYYIYLKLKASFNFHYIVRKCETKFKTDGLCISNNNTIYHWNKHFKFLKRDSVSSMSEITLFIYFSPFPCNAFLPWEKLLSYVQLDFINIL